MKFALVNGIKQTPEPKKLGICPFCNAEVISKCGNIKIWHWAHKGKLECDPWWENETEWHRNWKTHFPTEWQEVIQTAEDGQKHIADVKTDQGWVIEFQHSYLRPEERKARNEFYKKLVWVIDGKRLQNDEKKFVSALNSGTLVGPSRRISPDECSLLRDWGNIHAPVFFDFGILPTQPEQCYLWVLLPKSPDGMAYVLPCLRTEFIEVYLDGTSQKAISFEKSLNDLATLTSQLSSPVRMQPQHSIPLPIRRGRRF